MARRGWWARARNATLQLPMAASVVTVARCKVKTNTRGVWKRRRRSRGQIQAMADGLATAHDKSNLHRALSTASVLLRPFSPGVRLIGLGARHATAAGAQAKRIPFSDGPSRFIAPQVHRGQVGVGLSDAYSLGGLLA